MTKRLPWGHESRHCVRCGKVGPRINHALGYIHLYCLSDYEQSQRRKEQRKCKKEAIK